MREVMIRKDDLKNENDGYHIDAFAALINQLGMFPTEEEYEKIGSIIVIGEITEVGDTEDREM